MLDWTLLTIGIILLLLALAIGWVMTLFSLPGNWLIVAAALVFGLLVPDDWRTDLGWPTMVALVGLALFGELAELLCGSAGVRGAGGSRRAAFLSIIGSVLGTIPGASLGGLLGSIVPVFGTIAGVILGACLGALVGAMIGEAWKGSELDRSMKIGLGAFVGRLFGTVAKLAVASAMVAITLAALVL
ncbi:MAG: DUF456 domain-containing protein [Planctomycetes bacterium]|nr:DUF456 domain-containing protein [Planctomycetota bacterium]